MNWLRIGGALAGGVAALALLHGVVSWVSGVADNVQAGKRAKACMAGAKLADGGLDTCGEPVATLINEARQARICDQSLGAYRATATSGDDRGRAAFTIRMSCSAGVKDELARADTAAVNLADMTSQRDNALRDGAAAVDRAAARATSTAKRKVADDQVIAAQPLAADGRITCDAVCLRGLSEAP